MQCEICGNETAKPAKIVVDGSHLRVCENCSEYGTREQERPDSANVPRQARESAWETEPGTTEGYGLKIMQARQKQGLTIEELGKKVFEKASFLHRIESESVEPSTALARKIEEALGIDITEKGK